jgi:hypothetical protein
MSTKATIHEPAQDVSPQGARMASAGMLDAQEGRALRGTRAQQQRWSKGCTGHGATQAVAPVASRAAYCGAAAAGWLQDVCRSACRSAALLK